MVGGLGSGLTSESADAIRAVLRNDLPAGIEGFLAPISAAGLLCLARPEVLVCNAAHVKNVPGRKTDLLTELRGVAAGQGVA